MANNKWQVSGQYFESCNCDYLCPCLVTNMAARPDKGYCNVAMVFHIDQGHYGQERLDGLNFVLFAHAPGAMGEGNWSIGLITDERATPEQQQALIQIGSGQAGGPLAGLAPVVGKMLGVEVGPIYFEMDGMSRSVSVPGMLDQAVEGVPGGNPAEPMYADNVGHPVNPRLALARATRSHLHAFGINWDDSSGQNNGHFAPFNWQAA